MVKYSLPKSTQNVIRTTAAIVVSQNGCGRTPHMIKRDPMNAINIIAPYKWLGTWVFDDARVGLDKEPFVAGADIMMECFAADIPDAAKGFILYSQARHSQATPTN